MLAEDPEADKQKSDTSVQRQSDVEPELVEDNDSDYSIGVLHEANFRRAVFGYSGEITAKILKKKLRKRRNRAKLENGE